MTNSSPDHDRARERRRNLALRALIDEMLGKVRLAQRGGTGWEPGERERAELELAEIMARIRGEALARSSGDDEPVAEDAKGDDPR
ncbi:MAG: hypothetical protein M3373_07645 [Gemmatimonadota bacterium]|nr:hypothetical protein [Gemmatimonadota bacterium]